MLQLMAAINKLQNNKTINLTFNQETHPQNILNIKPRNIFTAKLKSRAAFTSDKGSKPPSNKSSFHKELTPTLRQNQFKDREMIDQSMLNQFEHLDLQDFLKVVIVGKSKLSQTKSKEIIRSLNGTWFKNTEAAHPVSRLYCSLPIKKQKSALISRKNQDLLIKPTVNDQFYKDYTPPNLFPKRKTSPVKSVTPQIRSDYIQTNKQILDGEEIKGKILKKMTLFRQRTSESRNKKRSSSYFSKNKSSVLNFFEGDNGCLLGRKMVIHD